MVPIRQEPARSGTAGNLSGADPVGTVPECVVLCGGLGTRLAGIAGDLPKAMVQVAGRPFLEWLLIELRTEGVTRVMLATGHRAEPIRTRLGDGSQLGVEIRYSHETAPLGTAGAVRQALADIRGQVVLVVNGDTYTHVPVAAMLEARRRHGALATLLAVRVPERGRYGALEIAADGTVAAFAEKRVGGDPGWISAGAYLVERSVIEGLPVGEPVSMETDVLPALVGRGLRAVTSDGPFVDIGTPESLQEAASIVTRGTAGCPA